VIPDTEKRKKHILKNQLWGVDINPMMIRLANATFTLYIKDTTNLICANSLEYDIGMKFDVVIGNPPYNDDTSSRKDSNRRTQGINLARKFCELAIDLSKHAIAILQPYNNKIYSDSLAMSYKAHGLYKIQDASNWFSVKQVIGAFYFNKQILVPEVSDEFQITPVLKDSLTQNLIIQAGKLYRKDYEHLLKSSGKYRVIVTTDIILYTDDINLIKRMEDRSFGKWRVVMGQNGSKTSLGKLILAEPADTLSYSVSCLAFNTEEEAKKCLAYLELESTKKLIATVKKGVGNNRRLFRFLPTLS
jgi:methylase of polypeptide subunit release factors